MRCRRARGGEPQAGIALLLVVWLLALLTVIAGEFMASGRVKAAAEHNKQDDLRGLALALAGYRAAVAALDDRIDGLELDDGRDGCCCAIAASRTACRRRGRRAARRRHLLVAHQRRGRPGEHQQRQQRPVLANLLQQCGLGPGAERDTVIDSILDWRDANRDHRLNGAEEDYYRGLDPPYSCKDGPFSVVEELLLVRGVTPGLFAGGEVDGKKKPGLRDLVSPRADGSAQRVDRAAGCPRGLRPADGPMPPEPPDRRLATLRDHRHRQTGRRRPASVAARRRASGG